jgi:ABC-type transport system involved in multi-copper enzyme maturation permease subunit
MRALFRKDYRLNRGVLLLGLVLLLAPYALVLGVAVPGNWPAMPPWAECLVTASFFSLCLSQLTLVTLAGNAIAAERADRSAEFLAYLPPSRTRILASKALLVTLTAGVIWAVNLSVADVVAPALGTFRADRLDLLVPRPVLAATAVMLVGAGWLGSALLDSPAIATALGIGAAAVVPFLVNFVPWPGAGDLRVWYVTTHLTLGLLCFVCGSAHYLRRVEP